MACVQNPRRLAILCGVVSVLSVIIGIAFIIVGPIKEKGFDEAHPCDDHCILRKTSSHYEVNECQGTGCCVGNDTSVKGSCNNIMNTYRQIHTAGIVLVSIVGVVTALTAVSIWYLGRRLTDPSSPSRATGGMQVAEEGSADETTPMAFSPATALGLQSKGGFGGMPVPAL